MQPHTGSLDPKSLVAYNADLIHLAFMPQTSILGFERLEYIFLCNKLTGALSMKLYSMHNIVISSILPYVLSIAL